MERISVHPNRKGIKFKQTYIKNLLKITRMKKYFISGVMAVAISAVFTGCSKSTDLYDEAAVEKNQQEQKIAQLKKAYNDAFIKEFGSIAPGHAWGFDKAKATRAVYDEDFSLYDLPDVLTNSEGKDYDQLFNAASNVSFENLPQAIKDGNYILQHVDKSTYKGDGDGTGNSSEHQNMEQLYAYNFNNNAWEAVTNFVKGKNEKSIKDDKQVKMTKGCTMMVGMGTPRSGMPIFKWEGTTKVDGKGKKQDIVCTNYVIRIINGEYYLGLGYTNENTTDYDAWIIKIIPAVKAEEITEETGRIFCEDLGLGGDIDFNDLVFDAVIHNDGSADLTILASGATYDIYIGGPKGQGGKKVDIGKMTNTGVNSASTRTMHFDSSYGFTDLRSIPVWVDNGELEYELTADYGEAPGKICTYLNVPWAKEYISIKKAYSQFDLWVQHATPDDWFLHMVDGMVFNLN